MKRLRSARPLEKTVYESICILLRLAGFTVYRLSQARESRQTKGLPDLYAFAPFTADLSRPMAVWIEVKRPGWRPSEVRLEQRAFQFQCAERQIAHVIGDLEAVTDWLVANRFLTRTTEGVRTP